MAPKLQPPRAIHAWTWNAPLQPSAPPRGATDNGAFVFIYSVHSLRWSRAEGRERDLGTKSRGGVQSGRRLLSLASFVFSSVLVTGWGSTNTWLHHLLGIYVVYVRAAWVLFLNIVATTKPSNTRCASPIDSKQTSVLFSHCSLFIASFMF